MAHQIEYLEEERILHVRVRGSLDRGLLNQITSEMVNVLSQHNCTRILLDHREAKPRLSMVELYDRPRTAVSLGIDRLSEIAIVYSENEKDYQFLETVARNQSVEVRLFTDIDEAIAWLTWSRAKER